MNKLYIIRFKISHDYVVSTWSAWTQEEAEKKMLLNPEWSFTLVEDNETHKIWDAR